MSEFEVRVITVDSFTQCRFGGNPAAVIPEASAIPQMYYPQIANEINLAQTAFVDEIEKDMYYIEFYTPNREINFSGHATIAAFYVLGRMGFIRPIENGKKIVHAKLKNGQILDVEIEYDNYEAGLVSILSPEITTNEKFSDIINKESIRKVLKIKESDISEVIIGEAFQGDIFVSLKNKEVLDSLRVDPWALRALNEKTGTQGLFAMTEEIEKPKLHTYARYFSPLFGIMEEAATGSSAVVAGKILLDRKNIENIEIYQGQMMKRPARIDVEYRDGKIWMSGHSRLVMDGIMKI
ncbi:MAG: PhzF family phenazine biosynthesis protein [Ezakiella sp.]|uniref:PhzF family phenazine biosynthesis protein n=1 Tax=Ezakiella sp. TaxID=1935205 RepID=UPI0029762F80|nr:PhzF family phenazine biosynthesis protein [Ezakiella sp.]MDD7731208.1 PhzF family phenazine biosynthesis protein [Eubacteriales bacterium]MDY6079802.1 PhzF family phenazine biosynthesis protein [Ezakiella sp.]